jgi:hypothetical protein
VPTPDDPYDEERLLADLVRNGIQLQRMKKLLQSSLARCESQLEDIDRQIDSLEDFYHHGHQGKDTNKYGPHNRLGRFL